MVQCKICGFKFAKYADLNRHISRIHADTILPNSIAPISTNIATNLKTYVRKKVVIQTSVKIEPGEVIQNLNGNELKWPATKMKTYVRKKQPAKQAIKIEPLDVFEPLVSIKEEPI